MATILFPSKEQVAVTTRFNKSAFQDNMVSEMLRLSFDYIYQAVTCLVLAFVLYLLWKTLGDTSQGKKNELHLNALQECEARIRRLENTVNGLQEWRAFLREEKEHRTYEHVHRQQVY